MVMEGAEHSTGLDGHHPHPQLAPFHPVDLAGKVDRSQQLHRDASGLRCHLLDAHRAPSHNLNLRRRRPCRCRGTRVKVLPAASAGVVLFVPGPQPQAPAFNGAAMKC